MFGGKFKLLLPCSGSSGSGSPSPPTTAPNGIKVHCDNRNESNKPPMAYDSVTSPKKQSGSWITKRKTKNHISFRYCYNSGNGTKPQINSGKLEERCDLHSPFFWLWLYFPWSPSISTLSTLI